MVVKTETLFKALGERNRLRIINMLFAKPMCVCEITDILGLSQSTVSGHLRVLKEAGLVVDARDGMWVEYHLPLSDPLIHSLLGTIRDFFSTDSVMKAERSRAGRTDRTLLCKK